MARLDKHTPVLPIFTSQCLVGGIVRKSAELILYGFRDIGVLHDTVDRCLLNELWIEVGDVNQPAHVRFEGGRDLHSKQPTRKAKKRGRRLGMYLNTYNASSRQELTVLFPVNFREERHPFYLIRPICP